VCTGKAVKPLRQEQPGKAVLEFGEPEALNIRFIHPIYLFVFLWPN